MKPPLKEQKNNHIIKVEIKEHYGNEHIYIVSDHKEYIQSLTGRKTITRKDITNLKELGYTFEMGLTPVVL